MTIDTTGHVYEHYSIGLNPQYCVDPPVECVCQYSLVTASAFLVSFVFIIIITQNIVYVYS